MNNKIIEIGSGIADYVNSNSPTILTGLTVAGVLATGFLSAKGAIEAKEIIDSEIELRYLKYSENARKVEILNRLEIELSAREKVKLGWKSFIPAILMGTATAVCAIGSNSINLRRNAALAALYSVTEKTLIEYKDKVIETIGEGKERKMHDDMMQDRLDKNPVEKSTVIITSKGTSLFFDSLSGRYFETDMETVRKVQNDYNKIVIGELYATLNEFYDMLGLEHTSLGESTGWACEYGLMDLKFSAKIATDGRPCIVIDYRVSPRDI